MTHTDAGKWDAVVIEPSEPLVIIRKSDYELMKQTTNNLAEIRDAAKEIAEHHEKRAESAESVLRKFLDEFDDVEECIFCLNRRRNNFAIVHEVDCIVEKARNHFKNYQYTAGNTA